MGALTPARPTGLLTSRACPGEGRGLPASRNRPSEPSVSNHRPAPMAAFTPRPSPGQALTPQRHRLPPLPGVWASPLYRRLARRYGRIEFLIVRMARSPPVALHPASRRRSYNRLQAGVGIPGEDLHLPDQLRSQAHGTGLRRCGLQNKQRLTPTDPSNGRSRVNADYTLRLENEGRDEQGAGRHRRHIRRLLPPMSRICRACTGAARGRRRAGRRAAISARRGIRLRHGDRHAYFIRGRRMRV